MPADEATDPLCAAWLPPTDADSQLCKMGSVLLRRRGPVIPGLFKNKYRMEKKELLYGTPALRWSGRDRHRGGRGLGRLYAMELARRGASVLVNDLGGSSRGDGSDASVADQVVAEIETAGGLAAASSDGVATPDGGKAIVDAAPNKFGRVDLAINNAGIINFTPFDHVTPE
jgi:hypothetical protein